MKVAVQLYESEPREHEHDWQPFTMPAWEKGRIFQCATCRVIGYRRKFRSNARAGGPVTGIVIYRCCITGGCHAAARRRLPGRATGGKYRWACEPCGAKVDEKAARVESARAD